MSQFLSSFTNPKFYGGSYELGPVTDFDSINRLPERQPGNPSFRRIGYASGIGRFQLQPAGARDIRVHHEHASVWIEVPSADRPAHRGDLNFEHRISGAGKCGWELWRDGNAAWKRLLHQSTAKCAAAVHHR